MNYDYKTVNDRIGDSLIILRNYANIQTGIDTEQAACCVFNLFENRFHRSFGDIWVGSAQLCPGGEMGRYRFLLKEYCEKKGLEEDTYFDHPAIKLLDELTLFSYWYGGNLIVMKVSEKPPHICLLAIQTFQKNINSIAENESFFALVWPGGIHLIK